MRFFCKEPFDEDKHVTDSVNWYCEILETISISNIKKIQTCGQSFHINANISDYDRKCKDLLQAAT